METHYEYKTAVFTFTYHFYIRTKMIDIFFKNVEQIGFQLKNYLIFQNNQMGQKGNADISKVRTS